MSIYQNQAKAPKTFDFIKKQIVIIQIYPVIFFIKL